jgi:hypothetical protein
MATTHTHKLKKGFVAFVFVVSCLSLSFVTTYAVSEDEDGDKLTLTEETSLGSNPAKADTDDDGLNDYDEVHLYKTEVLYADSDKDGLNDGAEIIAKTDARKRDTDSDGLSDGQEVNKYKTNPLVADTDVDGIPDGEEVKKLTNPLAA